MCSYFNMLQKPSIKILFNALSFPSIEILMIWSSDVFVKIGLVNWLSWSVLGLEGTILYSSYWRYFSCVFFCYRYQRLLPYTWSCAQVECMIYLLATFDLDGRSSDFWVNKDRFCVSDSFHWGSFQGKWFEDPWHCKVVLCVYD